MTKYLINKKFIYQNKKNSTLIFNSEKSIIFNLNGTASIILNKLKLGWEEKKIEEFLFSKFKVRKKLINNQITKITNDLLKSKILIRGKTHNPSLHYKLRN